MKDTTLNELFEQFKNPICAKYICATVLAEYRKDSVFIEEQLNETKSFVNVIWLGYKFKETIKRLTQLYKVKYPLYNKRFIVLHWVPSELINPSVEFAKITMPLCEDYNSLESANCKYELTPILKFYSNSLNYDKQLIHALRMFYISDQDLTEIQQGLNFQPKIKRTKEDLYNEVACNWLIKHKDVYRNWIINDFVTLYVGGIFPLNVTSQRYKNIEKAAQMAITAINNNLTILPGYKLGIWINDGACKSDMVLKEFIHYYNQPNVLGVLGPACSETVQPIAAISKHMNMMVISYSAESAAIFDREAYPYFFRTIGTDWLFIDAYLEIMKVFGWNRVAALTVEDHTTMEYTFYMESKMKNHNLTLILDRKCNTVATAIEMREHLHKLKKAQARIIFANIYGHNAAMAICEAAKLKMTQKHDYVWFFPSWVLSDLTTWRGSVNISCTASEFHNAIDGHFSVRHVPFGDRKSQMQDGQFIGTWIDTYKSNDGFVSNYAGYTYDAVWTYALAAHKLLQKNKQAVNSLRTSYVTKLFAQLIRETEFEGLSGKVSFSHGEFAGTRIIGIDILQWQNKNYSVVGSFKPRAESKETDIYVHNWLLTVNHSKIFWSNNHIPEDGTYDCNFSFLARAFQIQCETSAAIVAISTCFFFISLISLLSFLFWKHRYNRKVQYSAQIMKMFGIDLLSPSRSKHNTLDKWEIAKENVVINRRLGEGAFGMVYGGEAQLSPGAWTAVAVKTLKSGQTVEDRLDFLSEAEAMKKFNHKNIIKLLAVCVQSEPIYTIMEFMLYGDLKTYLLARRNMVNEKTTDESDISAKRLTMYSMDIAQGLAYLAKKKYVHRDIACRNCLVNAQRVVKIGDFGMARPTYESDYYRFNRKGVRKLFPVRWMPPETLTSGLFTPSSDIWSFGVVLFEVISFGSYPYQGLTNNEVLDYVKSGNTLQIPIGVKPQLKGLLKACWTQEADKRPNALEIIDYISNFPRLLTPCLDWPTAIQMSEIESDNLDLISQSSSAETKSDEKLTPIPTCSSDSISPITPDGYSIMSPLIMQK
ncbi:uncharacterized protein Dwil_GK27004 [Drosophila willistoni]|uniref:Protein kinase domain-containing protein n=1 Tax=Drosophila willistoni TaxID=7260 RepID=A0A0Q9WW41_DROWI|nr:uncharacterized protein Dwil_GK27004 [Drosophila willistoni]